MPGHPHFADDPVQQRVGETEVDLDEANEKLEKSSDDQSSHDHVSDKEDRGRQAFGDDLYRLGTNDKYEITEEDCYSELGFNFPTWKKWYILSVIFIVQVSMNFNTSLYSNGLGGIEEEFGVSAQAARVGAAVFLITYAFGCELWAPWSEEFGRWPIMQLSLFLVNIWQLPVALAPNFATIIVGRALGGLSSAGGSVTLGMIADMWESDVQQYAVAFVVFSSVGGSILGPIVGGFVEQYLSWRYAIWIQLIFGGFVQILHFFTVPETRVSILLNKIARKRRRMAEIKAEGKPESDLKQYPRWGFLDYFSKIAPGKDFNNANSNVWGPDELVPFSDRFSVKEVLITWIRPFKMFLTEPIVLTLSLLSGFSDALIFMFIQSFALVYKQWNFDAVQIGLAFVPIGIGYLLAWLLFIPAIKRNIRQRAEKPDDEHAQYESRLWFLLWTAPCLPIGLFGFAWTIQGPPIHWVGSMVFAAIVGIANYSIYMATIDYMICAYGPYSASATGGNGWSRDFLAGVLTIPATPFFSNIGASSGRNLEYASTILACISFVLVIAVYVIYWKGPTLRARSPFAQQLAGKDGKNNSKDEENDPVGHASRSASYTSGVQRPTSANGRRFSQSHRQFGSTRVTPKSTPRGTPAASRAGSITGVEAAGRLGPASRV